MSFLSLVHVNVPVRPNQCAKVAGGSTSFSRLACFRMYAAPRPALCGIGTECTASNPTNLLASLRLTRPSTDKWAENQARRSPTVSLRQAASGLLWKVWVNQRNEARASMEERYDDNMQTVC